MSVIETAGKVSAVQGRGSSQNLRPNSPTQNSAKRVLAIVIMSVRLSVRLAVCHVPYRTKPMD